MTTPGRSCPLHYRHAPSSFAGPPAWHGEVLYVVGGLYGNEAALQRVLQLFERERGAKRLVFNGDFHWFDAEPNTFARINRQVLAHDALRGNVETELAGEPSDADDDDFGCGCAYPDWVDDSVVEHSNQIMRRLRACAQALPGAASALAALPMWRRVDVGPLRLAIVHGDAESLAGWGFAQEHLRDAGHRQRVAGWFEAAQVDAFACSHTCLPVFQSLDRPRQSTPGLVLNNGAAGMPNFRGDWAAGLLTRVALRPFTGPQRRFGLRQGPVFIDALAIDIDLPRWHQQFLALWPPGSAGHNSYWSRLRNGPDYALADALRVASGSLADQAGARTPAALITP